MSKPYTHVINYGGKDVGQQMATLYRSSNNGGMLLAGIADRTVRFGSDPGLPEQRLFLTTTDSMAFLRRIADADASGLFTAPRGERITTHGWEILPREQFTNFANIEERDKDRMIALPGEDLPLPKLQ